MEEKEFIEKMQEKSNIMNINFSVEQLSKFYKYMYMLIEWNEKINLTAITDPEEIILKHFIDSITIYKDLPHGAKIVDVGTGAGFPGIPLAIIDNKLKITLVDSLNKRLVFLQEVKKEVKEDDLITIEDFKKVELVVGTVEECKKHPDADKLLVSKINLGKETRQIVSGIADYYSPEEFVGKKVIVVANLKPAKLRGVESQGMVLAGETKDLLEVINVENLPNGTKIR